MLLVHVSQVADKHVDIKCAVSLDAWTWAMEPGIKQQGIRKPFITIQTSQWYETKAVFGKNNDAEIEAIVRHSRAAMGQDAAHLARVHGAAHQDFTDLPFWAPLVTTKLLKFTVKPGTFMVDVICSNALAMFGRYLAGSAGLCANGGVLLPARDMVGVSIE